MALKINNFGQLMQDYGNKPTEVRLPIEMLLEHIGLIVVQPSNDTALSRNYGPRI